MMQVQQSQQFDWSHDGFVTLNSPTMTKPNPSAASPKPSFALPPSLLTQASVERFGQITPPEEHPPTHLPRHAATENSIPVAPLKNEPFWLQQSQPQQTRAQEPLHKRRRTRNAAAGPSTQPPADDSVPHSHQNNPPQPPKRKRGRPKLQPEMVEAYTANGLAFQVSTARQSHLEKNRVAAHKCRQRKKEYINGLEERARDFASKNKALKGNVAMLREEVLDLKNEVLRHAGCGFWAVDEYLARCAGDLLGMEGPTPSQPTTPSGTSLTMENQQCTDQRHDSYASLGGNMTDMSSPDLNDEFGGLELLRDYDDEEQS